MLASLLLLLQHLLSLHQLPLLLLLDLVFLQLLKVDAPLFRVHAGKQLFLLLCEVQLYGVPLQLDILASRTPGCPGVGQQQVPLSQVLLLLLWSHVAELGPLLHADALYVLLDDLLLPLHMGGHGPGLHLPHHPGLLPHHGASLLLLLLWPLLPPRLLSWHASRPHKLLLLSWLLLLPLPLLLSLNPTLLLLLLPLYPALLLLLKLELLFMLLQYGWV